MSGISIYQLKSIFLTLVFQQKMDVPNNDFVDVFQQIILVRKFILGYMRFVLTKPVNPVKELIVLGIFIKIFSEISNERRPRILDTKHEAPSQNKWNHNARKQQIIMFALTDVPGLFLLSFFFGRRHD